MISDVVNLFAKVDVKCLIMTVAGFVRLVCFGCNQKICIEFLKMSTTMRQLKKFCGNQKFAS